MIEKVIVVTEKIYAILGFFLFISACYLLYQYKYNYFYERGTIKGECFKGTERRIEVEYRVNEKTYLICKKQKRNNNYQKGKVVIVRVLNIDHEVGWIDDEQTRQLQDIPPR